MSIFLCAYGPSLCFFGEMSLWIFCLFFDFFLKNCISCLCTLVIKSLSATCFAFLLRFSYILEFYHVTLEEAYLVIVLKKIDKVGPVHITFHRAIGKTHTYIHT